MIQDQIVQLNGVFSKIQRRWRKRGAWGVLAASIQTLIYPVAQFHRRLVWQMPLEGAIAPVIWSAGESLQIIGPENLDAELTPELSSFLGGEAAASEIEGVRLGDRVFIASDAAGYLGRTCLFFDTKQETRRQARILGELPTTPILGSSFTTPAARGRGVHKRLVSEVFRYLQDLGCRRVVCEIDYENIASQTAKAGVGMSVCRQISDWKVLDLIAVQKVKESGRSKWRCLWIG